MNVCSLSLAFLFALERTTINTVLYRIAWIKDRAKNTKHQTRAARQTRGASASVKHIIGKPPIHSLTAVSL